MTPQDIKRITGRAPEAWASEDIALADRHAPGVPANSRMRPLCDMGSGRFVGLQRGRVVRRWLGNRSPLPPLLIWLGAGIAAAIAWGVI